MAEEEVGEVHQRGQRGNAARDFGLVEIELGEVYQRGQRFHVARDLSCKEVENGEVYQRAEGAHIATMVSADITAPAVEKLPAPGKFRQVDSGARRSVQDTGSANHLTSPKDLTQADLDDSVREPRPRTLQTADRQINVDRRVHMQSLPLQRVVDPLILPNCPTVNSTGRLVIDDRYEFHWVPVGKHSSRSWYVSPDKAQVLECVVDHYVPVLDDDECALRAPDSVCKPHAYEPQSVSN